MFGIVEMGLLVSCCLRLVGYDNFSGAAATQASQRKIQLSAALAERDNGYAAFRPQHRLHVYIEINVKTEFIHKCYRLTHRKQQKIGTVNVVVEHIVSMPMC